MLKIIINDNKFILLKTAISILVISNYHDFRVLFGIIALNAKNIYILALEMASSGNHTALCQLYRHTFVPYWPFLFPCIEEGDAKLAERRSDMRLSRGEAWQLCGQISICTVACSF